MSDAAASSADDALEDTRARLLALEIVTVAALNRLLGAAPGLQSAMDELREPGDLPARPSAGDRTFLDHVQANVKRLAASVTTTL